MSCRVGKSTAPYSFEYFLKGPEYLLSRALVLSVLNEVD